MKQTVPNAMPKFFENWCRRFDNVFNRTTQRQYFRIYLAGLLGESYRKNMSALAVNTVSSSYNSQSHFLHYAPWDAQALNERRSRVMDQCRQTKLQQGFTLIIDDSGQSAKGAR